jgi:hypothetical protein
MAEEVKNAHMATILARPADRWRSGSGAHAPGCAEATWLGPMRAFEPHLRPAMPITSFADDPTDDALLLAVGVGMLWSAFRKLEAPELVQQVHVLALWVAGGALIAHDLESPT